MSLVDARSGAFRELPGKLAAVGAFSPDSRLLAVAQRDDGYTTAVKLFDVATGQAAAVAARFQCSGKCGDFADTDFCRSINPMSSSE